MQEREAEDERDRSVSTDVIALHTPVAAELAVPFVGVVLTCRAA